MSKVLLSECPKCGKQSLVHAKSDVYECIFCDFKRDLAAKPAEAKKKEEFPWPLAIIATLILLLLVVGTPSSTREDAPPSPPSGSVG